jgi:hypothetical protein
MLHIYFNLYQIFAFEGHEQGLLTLLSWKLLLSRNLGHENM